MTKFGWLVVTGVLLLLTGIGTGIYILVSQTPHPETERPDQVQEIVLPPDELPDDTGSSTPATGATSTPAS